MNFPVFCNNVANLSHLFWALSWLWLPVFGPAALCLQLAYDIVDHANLRLDSSFANVRLSQDVIVKALKTNVADLAVSMESVWSRY